MLHSSRRLPARSGHTMATRTGCPPLKRRGSERAFTILEIPDGGPSAALARGGGRWGTEGLRADHDGNARGRAREGSSLAKRARHGASRHPRADRPGWSGFERVVEERITSDRIVIPVGGAGIDQGDSNALAAGSGRGHACAGGSSAFRSADTGRSLFGRLAFEVLVVGLGVLPRMVDNAVAMIRR
jgi:hypothetical protein